MLRRRLSGMTKIVVITRSVSPAKSRINSSYLVGGVVALASALRDVLSNPQQPRTQAFLASIRATQLCFGPRAFRRREATTGLGPATGEKQRHRGDI
jgi:hypothetical protein